MMRYDLCRRHRFTRWVALGALIVGASCSGSTASSGRSTASVAKSSFLGPLVARDESSTLSWGRDGGFSVPLPNGKDLWIFGDTPRYQFQGGKWNLTRFVYGTSAGIVSYTPGHRPTTPFDEIVVGHKLSSNNVATQFLPTPRLYMPDGSGRICNKANGGPSAGAVRWASGAVLLPDKTNVFIPYVDVCEIGLTVFTIEGWGFTEYNWKTNKFDVEATDVFRPMKSGAVTKSPARNFGWPVVSGNQVTMFSVTCCGAGTHVYTMTLPANTAAFRKPGSYVSKPVLDLPGARSLSVSPPAGARHSITMYQMTGFRGQYTIFTSLSPTGPWTAKASGILPKCNLGTAHCSNSINVHPELSTSSQLFVSYYLPGYGPGVGVHPDHSGELSHLVTAWIPL